MRAADSASCAAALSAAVDASSAVRDEACLYSSAWASARAS